MKRSDSFVKVSGDGAKQMRDQLNSVSDLEKLDITQMQGFYKKKHSHEIGTTLDFIHKLRRTGVLQRFFCKNDLKFAGIQELFDEFYEKLDKFIMNEPSMSKDHKLHKYELHELIMFQLHQEFFYNQQPSPEEVQFQRKLQQMYELEPAAYGIPQTEQWQSTEMKFAYKMAQRQLYKISES